MCTHLCKFIVYSYIYMYIYNIYICFYISQVKGFGLVSHVLIWFIVSLPRSRQKSMSMKFEAVHLGYWWPESRVLMGKSPWTVVSTVQKVQRLSFVGNRPILRERHLIQCGWLKKQFGPWIFSGIFQVLCCKIRPFRFNNNNHGWSTNNPTLGPVTSPLKTSQGNQWWISPEPAMTPQPQQPQPVRLQLQDVERWERHAWYEIYE